MTRILNNPKFRSAIYQICLISLVLLGAYWVVDNTITNLEKRNITSGFGFLDTTAGFAISLAPVEYFEDSSYGRALLVGFVNTLIVAIVGIVFATILGFIIGIGRLSSNKVINAVCYCYIESLRNIPLLLQILFWYFAVLNSLPGRAGKLSIFDTIHLNIRGLYLPKVVTSDFAWLVFVSVALGVIGSIVIAKWSTKRKMATGKNFPVLWTSLGLIFILPIIVHFLAGQPLSLEHPVFVETGSALKRGFERDVGVKIPPEFVALTLALITYTASFIAEIVRAGILAIDKGQTEAAKSVGLRPGTTLRLVIIPQALRVIIPPLTSQYLNLTKNSSLAVAIGFPDLVAVGGTVLNQTGQAIEIVGVWMVVYLSLSLLTSGLMNYYNKSIAIVER